MRNFCELGIRVVRHPSKVDYTGASPVARLKYKKKKILGSWLKAAIFNE